MTDPTSKHAWPLRQYDGSREGYEEYEVDKDAWLIDKGYDKHPTQTEKLENGSKERAKRSMRADASDSQQRTRKSGQKQFLVTQEQRGKHKGKKSIWQ